MTRISCCWGTGAFEDCFLPLCGLSSESDFNFVGPMPPGKSCPSSPVSFPRNLLQKATNSFGKSLGGTSGPGLNRCIARCRLEAGNSVSRCRAKRSSLQVLQKASSSSAVTVAPPRPLPLLPRFLPPLLAEVLTTGAVMPCIVCFVVARISQSLPCGSTSYLCFSELD